MVSRVLKKGEVTTVPLAMALAAKDQPETQPAEPTGPDDETAARELVREIDFTAKGAPRKTPLDS